MRNSYAGLCGASYDDQLRDQDRCTKRKNHDGECGKPDGIVELLKRARKINKADRLDIGSKINLMLDFINSVAESQFRSSEGAAQQFLEALGH